MLSKVVSSTIFKFFAMTRPGIEPRYPGPLANTLTTWPIHNNDYDDDDDNNNNSVVCVFAYPNNDLISGSWNALLREITLHINIFNLKYTS